MRVVALVSGGKDSTYCMMQCVSYGHTIVALANLYPPNATDSKYNEEVSAEDCLGLASDQESEFFSNEGEFAVGANGENTPSELDSYMYQTVGHEVLHHYAQCLDVPLFRAPITGSARHLSCDKYRRTSGDEVEDLARLLQQITADGVKFDAVASGAIFSDYQRTRVEHVCARVGVTSLGYLWRRDQRELLHEMIACRVHAVLVKVACLGLGERHLGASLADVQQDLHRLSDKYGVNVCGEGGEYETLTLDCPLFLRRLVIDHSQVIVHSKDAFAPVLYLRVQSAHTELKCGVAREQSLRVAGLPIPPLLPLTCIVSDSEQRQTQQPECYGDPAGESPGWGLPEARAISAGNWLYLGPVAAADGGMQEAMKLMAQLLTAHDLSLERLAFVDMYVADLSVYSRHNLAYSQALCTSRSSDDDCHIVLNPPVRCCVQVPLPAGCSVLLCAGAWRLHCPQTGPSGATLHVQSLSHWAPANIGPYSQAVRRGRRVHLAGMIGLEPARQVLVRCSHEQARLALRHSQRVLDVFLPPQQLQQQCRPGLFLLMATCFVTDASLLPFCRQLALDAWSRDSLMFVVVVNVEALPRSAAVEWQLTAHSISSQLVSPLKGASSQLCVAGVSVRITLRQIEVHCAAYALVRCSWNDERDMSTDGSNVSSTEAGGNGRVSQLRACLRAASQCLTSRCGGEGEPGCRLTVYYRHDFFGGDIAAQVAAEGYLRRNCVAVTVPVLQVEDGFDQCTIVGMADGSYSDKQD